MKISVSHLFAPIGHPLAAALETLLLPVAMLAIGVWFNPLDPLFVRAQFPWPWIAPLLLALRYGPLPGLGGAVTLFGGWYVLEGALSGSHDLPKLYFLGGLITVMLAGEFSSIWQGRVRRAEATQDYLDRRLDSLTQSHYLLRLSHDKLEQELFSRPVSMRDALLGLREVVSHAGSGVLPGGDAFLKLTSQFCQIERAALVPVDGTRLNANQAHFLGAQFELDTRDPLVSYAQEENKLCHVANISAEQRPDSRYLVVAPVLDVSRAVHALLIVDAMPFFALQQDSLQMLNLMLSYYGDSIASTSLVSPIQDKWPACPAEFALELQRLFHLHQESRVPSTLITLEFTPGVSPADLPNRLLKQQRSLDVTWLLGDVAAEPRALLAILPLARDAAVDGYLARIERWLRTNLNADWESAGVRHRDWPIGTDSAESLLANVLETCHVADQACTVRADR